MKSLLVANRGEIAIRVLRAADELGIRGVAIHSEDDADSLHVRLASEAVALPGRGGRAYLDVDQVVEAARRADCDALHPGYGFLSESSAFARACEDAGVQFVGPTPVQLELFGDKLSARGLAQRLDVPVVRGSSGAVELDEARAFFESLPAGQAMVLKAVAGGGGRGMRAVEELGELESAFERCQHEAKLAFGNPALYCERLVRAARHVEVQVVGDGAGRVMHLGERECTLQRRHQKLVELAPSPGLSDALRDQLTGAALRMAKAEDYRSLGTFEFLVEGGAEPSASAFSFIEANPRLQVEHTVTEEVSGVDLVQLQLRLAAGERFEDQGLDPDRPPVPRGMAMQLRINTESMQPDGTVRPRVGTVESWEPPTGPGVRVDSAAFAGHEASPAFDALLAKLVVHVPTPRYGELLRRADRALRELGVRGVETNASFLRALLAHPEVAADCVDTRFVERHAAELVEAAAAHAEVAPPPDRALGSTGARLDDEDPLAVLEHGRSAEVSRAPTAPTESPGSGQPVRAPMQGTLATLEVAVGDLVRQGGAVAVLEAMKMEHVLESPVDGVVREVCVAAGDTVAEGALLLRIEATEAARGDAAPEAALDLSRVRPDLEELRERLAATGDAARPQAVERRRKTGQRTARENVEDLCDADSFVEYGSLVIAAQRRRRAIEDLVANTPADGLVSGIGRVNGDLFGPRDARCAVLSYDYTVLAGTQGLQNHRKKDRLFEIAEQQRLPVVFFTEGGGGRPGDTDGAGVAGLDCLAFHYFGRLSGLVPLLGINSGRCFAGNAALLGCCDVVIATENSNIGMGGPAMIEGGGLGVFRPDEVGAMAVQVPNGVVDLPVSDEAEAVAVARRYLSYFQGSLESWSCADQRALRHAVPENRLRVYDVRKVIEGLADTGSVLELRRAFGPGMVTALARVEGRPLGIVANNPTHLAGAIDSEGADKAARFMQLCDAFDLPLLFLCDTPGMMVGPEVEKTGLVRHCSRLFVTGANLSVPFFTIVLRKGYGLGAQAMAGGSFHAPLFTVAWPTGEFGGMGLEGAVKLGYRKELEAVEDPEERRALFQEMVDRMYAHGKAVNMASHFEIDEVIDPVDSRRWILAALDSAAPPAPRSGKKRPNVDTW